MKATRERLVKAARAVFGEKGYRDTRITDIAERAGVAIGSFYNHFGSKDEILHAALADLVDEMYDSVAAQVPHEFGPFAQLLDSNRRYLAAYEANAPLLAVLEEAVVRNAELRAMRVKIREVSVQRIARNIARMQRGGQCDPGLDPHATARVLGSMVERSAYMAYVLGESQHGVDLALLVSQLWANAIRLRWPVEPADAASASDA